MKDLHLSVVVTTRNDDHGKNLLYRMQHFLDGMVAQCKRHDLRTELIFVEWNPPDDKPSLFDVLKFPKELPPCLIRIIRVPKHLHEKLENSEKVPLFQMIGKNVGIRRARGKFVLATNIDIVFSDELMRFLKSKVSEEKLYRVDRLDVPEQLPSADISTILGFCEKNYFRVNGKRGSFLWSHFRFVEYVKNKILHAWMISVMNFNKLKFKVLESSKLLIKLFFKILAAFAKGLVLSLQKVKKFLFILHTNACGDFTLISMKKWNQLRGYPEWSIFSWHIDSVLLYQAKNHGIKEVDLSGKKVIYHIEHDSGYTPEKERQLFERLDSRKIPYLTNKDFENLSQKLLTSKQQIVFNDENWGLGNHVLEEIVLT